MEETQKLIKLFNLGAPKYSCKLRMLSHWRTRLLENWKEKKKEKSESSNH